MTPIDPKLLAKAQAAGARLAAAEREALLQRAEYHTAIRRLHLGGASLREIAHTLALSHQRVQQIVKAAGGTWWQRMWRTRTQRRDAVCTFCERPPSELAKLLSGPNVFICDACVALAERTLAGESAGPPYFAVAGARARCTFCTKTRSRERTIATSSKGNVCAECLRLSREILAGG
jgi:hypothetical protein